MVTESPEAIAARAGKRFLAMAAKLRSDIDLLATRSKARTLPEFRHLRDDYRDIRDLMTVMESHMAQAGDRLPASSSQWLVRQKLRGLSIFTDISYAFIMQRPIALTTSYVARDVLTTERARFEDALTYFDDMLMEAGIDDKTSALLDATHTRIEEIMAVIGELLEKSPKPLEEFE
jgi:hypothetical protein